MILRQCCCCGVSLGAPIDDGVDRVSVSHGYCERHYDDAMLQLQSQFAELPADGMRERVA
jgi:hypothetical protein